MSQQDISFVLEARGFVGKKRHAGSQFSHFYEELF